MPPDAVPPDVPPPPRIFVGAEPGLYVVETEGALWAVEDRIRSWPARQRYPGDPALLREVTGRAAATIAGRIGLVGGPRGAGAVGLLVAELLSSPPRLSIVPPAAPAAPVSPIRAAEAVISDLVRALAVAQGQLTAAIEAEREDGTA